MPRKRKKQQYNPAMTAFAALLTAGLLAITAAVYMSPSQPDYDFDAQKELIRNIHEQDKPTEVEPVKLRKLKEPKGMDAREAELNHLYLFGTPKESAYAKQQLMAMR